MRFAIALLVAMIAMPALAQDTTVKQQDWAELNAILSEQVPPKWAQPVIKWANGVMQRGADEKVAGPKPEPKAEVKPETPKK